MSRNVPDGHMVKFRVAFIVFIRQKKPTGQGLQESACKQYEEETLAEQMLPAGQTRTKGQLALNGAADGSKETIILPSFDGFDERPSQLLGKFGIAGKAPVTTPLVSFPQKI